MNKIITKLFKNADRFLILLIIVYIILGLAMILSASSITSTFDMGTPYYYLIRQSVIVVISLAMITIMKYAFTVKAYIKLYIVFSICLMAVTTIKVFSSIDISGNNAVNIDLFGFTIQSAEFLKVFIVIYLGSAYGKILNSDYRETSAYLKILNKRKMDEKKKKIKENAYIFLMLIKPYLISLIPFIIVFVGGDKGSALLLLVLPTIIYLLVPLKEKTITASKIIILFFCAVGASLLLFGYRIIPKKLMEDSYVLRRFIYVDPCDRYLEKNDSGYQICNGFIAIDNGGLYGLGIGNSTQKYLYLPKSHTDFIFPIIIEELGGIIGCIIIIGYLLIIYLLFYIGSQCYNSKDNIICYGVGIYFLVEVFFNLGGVLGIIPLTGIPLPLLSYGGSNALSTLIMIGFAIKIAYYNKYKRERIIRNGE